MIKTILGIDEAGRGPVIGPLVMAGVKIEQKNEKKLIAIGVKDSKLLTPSQRDNLYNKILKIIEKYEIIIIPPKEIDNALNSDSTNLNWLEADNSIKIINELKANISILDCPSNNIKKYKDYIKNKLKTKTKLIAEHKADMLYPVVSAASILAKVTRDREIDKIKKKIQLDIGSGYPSDPITQAFLEKNYKKYPEIFRKTWASYQNIIIKKNQKKLDEF